MEHYWKVLPLYFILYLHIICYPPRIYQDAEVVHTQQFTSINPKAPLTRGNLGELTRNLLDLSPDDVVFYVGGYPDDFTVNMHFFSPSVTGFCVIFNSWFIFNMYLLRPFVFAFFSHLPHSTMANTRVALNFPPSMTNLSVFTTLRMQLILT